MSGLLAQHEELEEADKAKIQKIQDLERERTGLLETIKGLKRENDVKNQKIEDFEKEKKSLARIVPVLHSKHYN